MIKNTINISYCLCETNWQKVYLSILSLAKTTKHQINIYITFDNWLKDNIKNLFLDLDRKNDILNIIFVFVDEKLFSKFKMAGFSSPYSFHRLVLPQLCPNLDRILFLTANAICMDDLLTLYTKDLNDHVIACCEDIMYIHDSASFFKSMFDTTIMLIDCKKIRDYNLFTEFERFLSYKYELPVKNIDYIYNAFFANKWHKLDFKYNYVEYWFSNSVNRRLIRSDGYKNAKENPIIINFKGDSPQYTNCKHSMKDLWWQYASKAPFEIKKILSYKLATTSAQNSFKYAWLLSRIWPYIKPYWFRILLGFLIAIPLGLLDGVTAFALKPYMDYVIGGKDFAFNWHGFGLSISSLQMAFIIPVGVILFTAFQGVLRYLNGYFSTWTSQRITNDVKFDLFKRLIHMHPQFFDDNSSGIVISRYMGDPGTASAGIVDNVKTITTSLCGALGLIAVMLYSSWKLAFIGVLVLCVAFIPVILIRKRIKEASNKNMVIGSNITTNINETYSGNKVMAAYELQERQDAYFRNQVWRSFNINMSLYKRAGWMSPLMYLIASFGIATVLGVGTYLINSGQMTAGSFASFVTSLLLLYKPVKTLGNTLTGIQNIFVAMGRVFELFDLDSAIKDCDNPIELNGLNNKIEFKNVNFEYVPNQPVLKDLNLTVTKNETLAVVGNSGGGKSTLVNLIPRFYDIKSGSITIDDVDIRKFSLKSLRHNISMVFQDNFLYSGTIKENIMMGDPNATTEGLMSAIKSAHLQDLISELPDGLDTMLGERGLTLSGGQRQRVAIARAMLRNAPIVILDEATSALDNESEAIVQKAMDNLMKDRTVFIIAHRLSTIKNADRIAVINEGELVELGTHEELMSMENGQYKALYEMQFKKQEIST